VRTASASLGAAAYNIAGQEKVALLTLDQVRNRLLKVDVAASSVSAAAGLGACIASVFGMNTPAPILANVPSEEKAPGRQYETWLFLVVTSVIAIMIVSFIVTILLYLYGSRCRPIIPGASANNLTTQRHRRLHKRKEPTQVVDRSKRPSFSTPRWPSFSCLPRPAHGAYQSGVRSSESSREGLPHQERQERPFASASQLLTHPTPQRAATMPTLPPMPTRQPLQTTDPLLPTPSWGAVNDSSVGPGSESIKHAASRPVPASHSQLMNQRSE